MTCFLKAGDQIREKSREMSIKSFLTLANSVESSSQFISKHKTWFYMGSAVVLGCFLADTAAAVSVDSLKVPIQDLKKEVFGSWMMVAKIAAGAVGAGFAIAKQSLSPFGIGAGITVGIHFYDTYIGDGSGALM